LRTPLTLGDIALNTVSIVLAGFSASFAWYMVMYGPNERGGEVPKITVALEPFDTTRDKLGSHDALDPIVTGSIAKSEAGSGPAKRAMPAFLQPDQHLRYNLRTVFKDTAFVDVSNGKSVVTMPVEMGAQLPGVGRVLRFENRRGKWILITSSTEISEDGMVTLK
jgi:hypothetical protein